VTGPVQLHTSKMNFTTTQRTETIFLESAVSFPHFRSIQSPVFMHELLLSWKSNQCVISSSVFSVLCIIAHICLYVDSFCSGSLSYVSVQVIKVLNSFDCSELQLPALRHIRWPFEHLFK
jgi:hypothetical protein